MKHILVFACLFTPHLIAAEFETVAGAGDPSNNGNYGAADTIHIGQPFGVEVGPDGALYITEVQNHRVLRLDLKTNQVTTVAGTGEKGYTGDGGQATEARLNEPYEVRFDSVGNMYVVEMMNHIVRVVDNETKKIRTIAGTGEMGFGGDGGPALKAQFHRPHSIALHGDSALLIADIGNHRVRRIDLKTGHIESIAGNGAKKLPLDGGSARGKPVIGPRALFVQGDTLWLALREGHSVWSLDLKNDRWRHIAGAGKAGYSGDGGDPLNAAFNGPKGIAVDPQGRIVVVDTENHAIRRIDLKKNVIETIAGDGPRKATIEGKLNRPHGVCVHPGGDVYVGDTNSHRVQVIRSGD